MKFEPLFSRASVPQLLNWCDGYMLFASGQIQTYTRIATKILYLVFQFNPETGYGSSYRPRPILCGYEYQYLNLVFLSFFLFQIFIFITQLPRSPELWLISYSALRKFNVFIETENDFSLIVIFSARFQYSQLIG